MRTKWLTAIVAISLSLGACYPPTQVKLEREDCDLSLPVNQTPQSDTIDIAIHVDGTPSMEGYVQNNTSYYVKTLEALDSLFRVEPNVQYYRLGETSEPINANQFPKAQLPQFYDGTDPDFPSLENNKTEAAISPTGKNDRLSVIVTDLYQKDSDITSVSKKIKEHYLNKDKPGYAIGILAIRSEFNGDFYIENIQGTSTKAPYDTTERPPEEYRPFYVIFLGPLSKITDYFDDLHDEVPLSEDSKLVIFSPQNIVSKLSHIQAPQRTPPKGVEIKKKSLNNRYVALEVNDRQKIQLLEIDRDNNNQFELSYSVPFAHLRYQLLPDPKSIKTKIDIKEFKRFYKRFDKPENSQLQKALELKEWEVTKNQLKFITSIDPNLLEPNVYHFTVDVIVGDLKEQSWWVEWNANENSTDGSKTQNLLRFLRQLKRITMELIDEDEKENEEEKENPALIARFCYAIQKN